MWFINFRESRIEALALALARLSSQGGGMGAVTVRSLGREARMAAGTITNTYADKDETLRIATVHVGRWLAMGTADHVQARGPVGLFPEPGDRDYRQLVCTWAHLEAYGLANPEVCGAVLGGNTAVREQTNPLLREAGVSPGAGFWARVRGLRLDLLQPHSDLTPQ